MILTEFNICHYLLGKNLLDTSTIVNGEFSVRRSDSRNHNFIINKEYDHHHYFIKQIKANDQEKIESLRTEAHCYQLAESAPAFEPLKEFLPQFYQYDRLLHTLIIEEIKNAQSLQEFLMYQPIFNLDIPIKLGELLASFHTELAPDQLETPSFQAFKKQMPWTFTLPDNDPGPWLGHAQTAEQQAMQLIYKNHELLELIQQQQSQWSAASVVHNDVKFTNLMISIDSASNSITHLKLIDWELADIGDPLWDAASVLENYLLMWLTAEDAEIQRHHVGRKITLPEIRPSMQAFWHSYANSKNIPTGGETLHKAIAFCALKLIHACFEFTPHTSTLQPISVRLLQTGLNILRSPSKAATQLFGFQ